MILNEWFSLHQEAQQNRAQLQLQLHLCQIVTGRCKKHVILISYLEKCKVSQQRPRMKRLRMFESDLSMESQKRIILEDDCKLWVQIFFLKMLIYPHLLLTNPPTPQMWIKTKKHVVFWGFLAHLEQKKIFEVFSP